MDLDKKRNDFATTASISGNKVMTKKARAHGRVRRRAAWRNGGESGWEARVVAAAEKH